MKTAAKNNYLKNVLRNFQLLSLDVVAGVLAMAIFATKLLQVNPNKWWWFVLALSVWSIYTSDHLIDGFSKKNHAVIRRHQIHYLFHVPLIIAITLSASAAIILTFLFLNKTIIIIGSVIGFFTILYLTLVFFSKKLHYYFHKEFFISLFYVIGIWFTPVSIYSSHLSPFHWLTIVSMILLVWYEGIVISTFEIEKDIKDEHNSFAVKFKKNNIKSFLILLIVTVGLAQIILFMLAKNRIEFFSVLIETVMTLALFSMSSFPGFFKKHEYYKTFGELIFWLPGLLYLINY